MPVLRSAVDHLIYLPLKQAHVLLVAVSGALFAARGVSVLAGQTWAMARSVRIASVAIDTQLLAAGVSLWVLLGLQPLRDPWLGAKIGLLLVYIVLGSFALKRGRTPRGRLLAFVAALACFGWMVSIALTHHPLVMSFTPLN